MLLCEWTVLITLFLYKKINHFLRPFICFPTLSSIYFFFKFGVVCVCNELTCHEVDIIGKFTPDQSSNSFSPEACTPPLFPKLPHFLSRGIKWHLSIEIFLPASILRSYSYPLSPSILPFLPSKRPFFIFPFHVILSVLAPRNLWPFAAATPQRSNFLCLFF